MHQTLTLFITSKLEKQPNLTDSFSTKLNEKFPCQPVMLKQCECILILDKKSRYTKNCYLEE
jgi:hypothetical protein